MPDNRFLITGLINGKRDYLWFSNEEELADFIQNNIIVDYEAIEIISCREIITDAK